MIKRIEISNFALIAELDLVLGDKVNVFSGETGAGKSILLDALAFLLGARSNTSWIRSGHERMRVTGTFWTTNKVHLLVHLQEHDLVDDVHDPTAMEIQIWRELQVNGRSQARINGRPVSISFLRALGSELMELQGQQETLRLLQQRYHLAFIDQYGDSDHHRILKEYAISFEAWRDAKEQITLLAEAERESNRLEDLWRFQMEEISRAVLSADEEEYASSRIQVLRNAGRLSTAAVSALNMLNADEENETASSLLYKIKRELEGIQHLDERATPWVEVANSLYWQMEELARDLSSYIPSLDADQGELERLEERMALIRRLKSKYGDSIEAIMQYFSDIQSKVAAIERREEEQIRLAKLCQQLEDALDMVGQQLSASRRNVALKLQEAVMKNLSELRMASCRFEVSLNKVRGAERSALGLETGEFLIAPNPGEPLKPMAQIASGGELARILLALKTALIALDMPDIMVFDEPDSGLSGTAVKAMAAALSRIGESCQVLLVTHQAPVAAIANHHYLMGKESHDEETFTYVSQLDREGRISELVRLLASDETSTSARRHAEEMLELHK